MPVSLSSQLGSKEQADTRLVGSVMSALRVSMPGIVQSFDPDTVTAVVQPAIKGYEPDSNGVSSRRHYRCWWMCRWYFLAAVAAR